MTMPRRTGGGRTGRAIVTLAACALALAPTAAARDVRQLRACADPNNLPFSNQRGEGFENKLAVFLARELHASLRYTWWARRRGYVRNTRGAGECDVLLGVPAGLERALTTRPYYRSAYVFVYPKNKGLSIHSFDDPALRTLRIGVQLIGDDYTNTPPAHALSRRHIIGNVSGFTVYGDYTQPNPPARIIDAVAAGTIDVAIVWGPLGGYFAKRERIPLDVVPVSPQIDPPRLPLAFDIALGVREGDRALRDELQRVLDRKAPEIARILEAYGVPLVPALPGAPIP